MGLQDNLFPKLLARAEGATTVLTNAELLGVAATPEEGEEWTQLCNNHKYNTYSSASPLAQQQQSAGNTKTQWAWKSTGKFARGLQYLLEQEALDTSQSFSTQKWNKKRIPHKTSRTKIRQQQL